MSEQSIDLLLITWNFPPKVGGMENLMYSLYRHLRGEIRIAVIAPFDPTFRENSEVFRSPFRGFLSFCIYALFKGLHVLFRRKPRVIMGGSLVMAPILCFLKFFAPVRSVAYAHGLDIVYQSPLYQRLLQIFAPMLDGVICNSNNTRRLLQQKFPETSVQVIPPGVDFKRFKRTKIPCYPGKYMLSVGRLTERKGLEPFIRNCFVNIAEEMKDLAFIVIGSDPKDAMAHSMGCREKILSCLRETGLEGRVLLMGSVAEEDLISFYQHCEVLVLPVIPVAGDVEGFGIVAIEAAAAGKPVVAFDEGGIRDAVVQGLTGFLFPQGDYRAMTKALLSINRHEYCFSSLHERASEKFGWRSLIEQYKQFLFPCVSLPEIHLRPSPCLSTRPST